MRRRLVLVPLLSFMALAGVAFAGNAEVLREGQAFQTWLTANEVSFLNCEVKKVGDAFVLCDNTEIPAAELRELFRLEAAALVNTLQKKGAKIEILCDANVPKANFAEVCTAASKREAFKKLTHLHGQYLPEDDVILVRSSSSRGSLIHEYLHRYQSKNTKPVFGKIYKAERNRLQRELVRAMDATIAQVQALEKAGKKKEALPLLPDFMGISDLMQNFGPWQDLIDERGIFVLYLKYGQELGVSAQDLALARKNMGFICKSKTWGEKLAQNPHCKL